MKVTSIPIVIGVLGIVANGLIKGQEDLEIRGWVETLKTTASLWSVRILETLEETCCHSNFSERLSAKTDVKNSQGVIIMIIIIICLCSYMVSRDYLYLIIIIC